jgi:hypothetical protein
LCLRRRLSGRLLQRILRIFLGAGAKCA